MRPRPAFDPQFTIFGHRGAAGCAPENTLLGFHTAIAQGVAWIECDVQAHPEALLLFHDDRLRRTTGARGRLLDTPLATLKILDAGGGSTIPTLQEALAALQGKVALNIELKAGDAVAERTGEALCRAVEEGWDPAQLLVSAFDHTALQRFCLAAPQIPVAPLFDRPSPRMVEVARSLDAAAIHIGLAVATPIVLSALEEARLPIHVYTINQPALADRLRERGVSGIFTDYPQRFILRD